MSDAKPFSREELAHPDGWVPMIYDLRQASALLDRALATVRGAEARAEAAEGAVWAMREVIAYHARRADAAGARADALAVEGDELARLLDESLEREKALEAGVDALRAGIEAVLADDETAPGGRGPDVTMQGVLREALGADDRRRDAQGEGT